MENPSQTQMIIRSGMFLFVLKKAERNWKKECSSLLHWLLPHTSTFLPTEEEEVLYTVRPKYVNYSPGAQEDALYSEWNQAMFLKGHVTCTHLCEGEFGEWKQTFQHGKCPPVGAAFMSSCCHTFKHIYKATSWHLFSYFLSHTLKE